MRLIADITANSDCVRVRCKGQILNDEDVESIARNVVMLQSTPTLVLVDLSELASVRHSHLGMLWLHYMHANACGWKIAFVHLPGYLRSALRDSGLEHALPTFESEIAALEALGQNGKASSAVA